MSQSYFAFDAVWAVAIALNSTLNSHITYENLTDLSMMTMGALRDKMANVKFEGLTVSRKIVPPSTISTLPHCCKLEQRILGKIPEGLQW